MTWTKIANEGQTVEVPAASLVRYGASAEERFIEREVSGSVTASNAFFGADPARGTPKGLWRLEAAQTPADPQMPALGDPQFDQKARLYEAWQRNAHNEAAEARSLRYVEITTALVAAQNRAAAAMERALTDGIPGGA
jgi:hypothetical protein